MNKYKLINKTTGEEYLCDKVVIDGWDYYVSDDLKVGDKVRLKSNVNVGQVIDDVNKDWRLFWFKPIATNNPSIDIPKVVDEVETLAESIIPNLLYKKYVKTGFIGGYNKSQETHPFDEEDVIEFLNWIRDNTVFDSAPKPYHRKTQTRLSQEELLQLWKKERPKTLYYE